MRPNQSRPVPMLVSMRDIDAIMVRQRMTGIDGNQEWVQALTIGTPAKCAFFARSQFLLLKDVVLRQKIGNRQQRFGVDVCPRFGSNLKANKLFIRFRKNVNRAKPAQWQKTEMLCL